MDVEDSLYDKPCRPDDDSRCYWANSLVHVLPTILLPIGTFGNILNVALLSRKTFRNKPVFLLMFLSIFDFFCLWTTIPWRTLDFYFGIRYYDISPTFCKLNAWISIFSASASFWIMGIVSINRSVVVFARTQLDPLQNRNQNLVIMFCVVLVVLVISGVWVWFGHTDEDPFEFLDRNNSSMTKNCFYISSEFESNLPHVLTAGLVFQLFIPVLAVLIGNVTLMTYFCKRRRLFANSQSTDSQTKVLLLLTNYLLIAVIPFGIVNFLLARLHGNDNFISPNLAILKALAMCLILSNYALNFLFFFLGGTMFRKEMKLMLDEARLFSFKHPTSRDTEMQTSSNRI